MAWWRGRRYYRIVLLSLLIIGVLYFLYLVRGLFLSFILAVVLTYLLNPAVTTIEHKGMPRLGAILIIYSALIIITGTLVFYGMPHILLQLNQMIDVIPEYTVQVRELVQSIQQQYARAGIPEAIRDIIEERIVWVEESLVQLARRATEGITGIVGYIFNIILAPVLAYYMLKDVELFRRTVVRFIPSAWRDDALALGSEVHHVLNSFIRGYLTVSLIVGMLTWLAMTLLGVELALVLGIFAGLTNIIPYFGPLIGALPAVLIALLTSKLLALKVIIAFGVIQQLESSVISPKILGDRVGLHPLFVILVVLAGGQLYSLIGIILAVPVSAILKVIIEFVLKKFLIDYNS